MLVDQRLVVRELSHQPVAGQERRRERVQAQHVLLDRSGLDRDGVPTLAAVTNSMVSSGLSTEAVSRGARALRQGGSGSEPDVRGAGYGDPDVLAGLQGGRSSDAGGQR